jgi:hypothetical protein
MISGMDGPPDLCRPDYASRVPAEDAGELDGDLVERFLLHRRQGCRPIAHHGLDGLRHGRRLGEVVGPGPEIAIGGANRRGGRKLRNPR